MSLSTTSTSGSKNSDADDEADTDENQNGASAESRNWLRACDERYIFSYGRALEPKYSNPSIAGYYRPWRFIDKKRSGVSRIFYARSREFRIALDVSQFEFENVLVKLVGEQIVVEAQHPTAVDYLGRVSRLLVRKYKTPPDLKLNTVTGKHKRGFLILWGDRDFQPAEKPEPRIMDDQDGGVGSSEDEDDDDTDGGTAAVSKKNAAVASAKQLQGVADVITAELEDALGIGGGGGSGVGARSGPAAKMTVDGATNARRKSAKSAAELEEIIVRIRKSESPPSPRLMRR